MLGALWSYVVMDGEVEAVVEEDQDWRSAGGDGLDE